MTSEADPQDLAGSSVQGREWQSWERHRRRIYLLVILTATIVLVGVAVFALRPLHDEMNRQQQMTAQALLDQSARLFDANTRVLLRQATRLAADVALRTALMQVADKSAALAQRLDTLLGEAHSVVGLAMLSPDGVQRVVSGHVPHPEAMGQTLLGLRPVKLEFDDTGLMFTLAMRNDTDPANSTFQVVFDEAAFRHVLAPDVTGVAAPFVVWHEQVFFTAPEAKQQLQDCGGIAALLANDCGKNIRVLQRPLSSADWSLALVLDGRTSDARFAEALNRLPFGLLLVAGGVIFLVALVVRPLNRLFQRTGRLYELSARDELTGLNNRRHLMQALDVELARAVRHDMALNVMLLDIDLFKPINDTHGHAIGDLAIKEVAQVVARISRSEDVTARLGGDEFVVVQTDVDLAGAVRFAERLRQAVGRIQIAASGSLVELSVSVGVAHVAAHTVSEVSRERVLRIADRALYKAKAAGRNQVAARGVRSTAQDDSDNN